MFFGGEVFLLGESFSGREPGKLQREGGENPKSFSE